VQQLHLVGFTTDQEGLIFSARKGSKSGGYVVVLDKKLLNKIDDAKRRRQADDEETGRRRPDRAESVLSPREIQARLRSGRTIVQVAREAGVDEEWVARFAAPIQAEQAQVITRARSLVFAKARLGDSAQPLGEAVVWNTAEKGVRLPDDVFDDCWSAFHLREHEWVVRFAYFNRKKVQHAEWEVDLREGVLTARNRLGSDLGYVEPGRRRKRLPAAVPPPAAAKPTARRAKKRPATKKASSARPAAKRPAARKGPAKKVAAKRAAAKKTTGKKTTGKKTTARKTAARKSPRKAPVRKATRRPAAATAAPSRPVATATRPATPSVSRPAGGSVVTARPFPPPPRPERVNPPPPVAPSAPATPAPAPETNHPAAAVRQQPEPAPIRIDTHSPRRDDPSPMARPERPRPDDGPAVQDGEANAASGVIRLPSPSSSAGTRRRRPLRAR
jgi:hypothetical protein